MEVNPPPHNSHPITLEINLPYHSYSLSLGNNLHSLISNTLESLFQRNIPLALITDTQIAIAQKDFINKTFPNIPKHFLPSGESTKSFSFLLHIYDFLSQSKFNREGILIALGGGVVGDLAGFAAATFMRGISLIQIPTTLLAMVDSAIGGKTGINLPSGKNLIGAFHHPKHVYIDPLFLKTLPKNHFNSGFAEIIKYSLLSPELPFQILTKNPPFTLESPQLLELIHSSCKIKTSIISQDEKESSSLNKRILLNLGHTFAHAIESVSNYSEYLHGEAVALGLILATRYSSLHEGFPQTSVNAIHDLILKYNLPCQLKSPLNLDALLEAMFHDKKNQSGKIKLVLLKEIGNAFTQIDTHLPTIKKLWLEVGAVED